MFSKTSHPIIEALESRIAPAGFIDVIVKNGALIMQTVPGDDGVETLRIINGPGTGEYLLDVSSGTRLRINGIDLLPDDDFVVKGITKSISVSLGAGNDVLSMASTQFGGTLKVDLGDGDNIFSLTRGSAASLAYQGGADEDLVFLAGATIPGSVSVNAGDGENLVDIGGVLFGGDLTVKAGDGPDYLTSVGAIPSRIAGKFSAALGDGDNTISLIARVIAGRDVSLTTGNGDDSIRFGGNSEYVFGGNLSINSGTGRDTIHLAAGSLLVTKNLSLASGGLEGVPVTQRIETFLDLSVGGNLSLKSGSSGRIAQEVVSSFRDVSVGGSISFRAAGGETSQSITVDQALTVGKGISLLTTGESGAQNVSTTIANGLGISSVSGPVNFVGAASVHLGLNGDVRGPVKITLDEAASGGVAQIGTADVNTVLRIHGPVTVNLNSQAGGTPDAVSLVNTTFNGCVTLLGGAGNDKFELADVQTFGALKINGGAGDDELRVERQTPLDGRSNFLGTVTFKGGAGDDDVYWGGDAEKDTVFAAKLVTIDGGAGANTYTQGGNAIFFLLPKLPDAQDFAGPQKR